MSAPTALDIARDLIRCASVTPADGGALDVVARVLGGAGFQRRARHVQRARTRPTSTISTPGSAGGRPA